MSAGLCMPPGAAQAAQQLAAGELRASALLEQCLARIARHNPAINALVTLDEARARRAADSGPAQRGCWWCASPEWQTHP